jgi:D-ribose pyranose/furanose isomerase RbsD
METKHKKATEKITALEKLNNENEVREEAFRQEIADRNESYRRELNTANNLRHKAVSEFDTMKEMAENAR